MAVNRQKLPAADRAVVAERQNSPFSGAGGVADQTVRQDFLIEAQGLQRGLQLGSEYFVAGQTPAGDRRSG